MSRMYWPTRTDYDHAIMLASSRLRIPDPQLLDGHVEEVTISGIASPWGMEGGFAIVYKFRRADGRLCALRCFKKPVPEDIQLRYDHISDYFARYAPHVTAGSQYFDQGIKVTLGFGHDGIFPVIVMEWVEGVTLLRKVDQLCQTNDQAGLSTLVNRWPVLVERMGTARIAHGDLASENIMVQPDGQLVLVDYDGVYIPEFHGRPPVVLGQPDYQHPQMSERAFDENMDWFSALVIYTALLALKANPKLWEKYAKRDARSGRLLDTNLLFEAHDLIEPGRSNIFKELAQIDNPELRAALRELECRCHQPAAFAYAPLVWTKLDAQC